MTVATEFLRCPVCSADLDELPAATQAGEPFSCPKPYCGVSLRAREDRLPQAETCRLLDHYSLCVLPFAFSGHELHTVFRRLQQSKRWTERVYSMDDPDDVDRMEYFLPYIRNFLFPQSSNGHGVHPSERTCTHWYFDLEQLGGDNQKGLGFRLQGTDERKRLSHSWNLKLVRIKLMLFSYRVGFLILDFGCADPDATLFDQMSALNFLRPIAPLYQGYRMAKMTVGESSFQIPQLLSYLLAEFDDPKDMPAQPEAVRLPAELPVRLIYDDRMMVYTFSCLDKQTCLDDGEHCQKLMSRTSVIHFEEGQQLPQHSEPGDDEDSQWLRARYQGFSKEGTCLVVFNSDRYHERFLGLYHGTYYFDAFLLASLQRVTLLTLYEQLSRISALTKERRHSQVLRKLRRDLLLFKNQCCFSQITNRERGLELWRRWQEVFENSTLLQEVNDQAAELDSYLRGRMRERFEGLLRLGGFLAASIPIILGLEVLFPAEQWGSWVTTLRAILFLAVILGSGLFACWLLFRQQD